MKTTVKKHVLVSGGSRGLGLAFVEELLKVGYVVSTFSRHETEATERLSQRDDFFFQTGDMADHNNLENFVKNSCQRFGRPWGLVNSAAIATESLLATVTEGDLHKTLAVNLEGTLWLTRLTIRQMLLNDDQSRSIVNISSVVGHRGYRGLAVYSATKGAIEAATRSICREIGPRQIRINTIAPGYLETDMTETLDPEQREQIIRRTPLGRLGKADDITGLLLFLLSKDSNFITGQTFLVDGGLTS
ncbi:MAG: SDR family oxidoreductase [Pirellulaceae bacterium]|nr:SDR family oxidoreductase [Pirellulaceae bacterium]